MNSQSAEIQEQVSGLKNDIIRHGESIVDRQIKDFECLGCGNKFTERVKATGSHTPHCLWNYYLDCPCCAYQNNLAKVLDTECECHK
jgi:hypothetical protein